MSLEHRLTDDMKAAMKAGEKETLGVVRRVLAALKNTHELGGSHRKAGFGVRAEARP